MFSNFFKKHPEFVIIGLAVFFIAVIIASFFWGITTLVSHLNRAVSVDSDLEGVETFNVEGAAALNLKGALR